MTAQSQPPFRVHATPLLITLLALCVMGCEKPKPKMADKADHAQTRGSEDAPTRQPAPLRLELQVVRAQMPGAIDAQWVPDEEAVKTLITKALSDPDTADTSAKGELATIDYAALEIAPPQQPKQLVLATAITLDSPPARWQDRRIERVVTLDPMPEEDSAKRAKIEEILTQLAEAITARHALAMTADEEIVAMLLKRESITLEQAHDALERLRARHRSTPYTGEQKMHVIELLEQLATREDPRLITGVFAALAEFGASNYGKLLVDATTGTSRRGEYPAFVALLALMGEVREPEVTAYLQSVATGHPEESIRQIASESLARHKP